MLLHVLALQPGFHVPTGFVGAAFIGTAVQTSRLPWRAFNRLLVASRARLRFGRCGLLAQAPHQLGVRLARERQGRQLVFGLIQDGFDDTVRQQIRVAADRAGEVGVGRVRQAEVPTIGRRVDGLLHGAQQHGMNLQRVGTLLGGFGNGLEFARRGVVTDADPQAARLEVIAQGFLFFWRRTFVDAKQPRVLALGNEIGTAHIGRQHGLLNQAVRHGARAWDDFFDAAVFVTDDLRFGGLKIDRTALLPRLQQRQVGAVQMQQIVHQRFALCRFRTAGVGQYRGHFGIGEAGVAPHPRGVELVGFDLAFRGDKHVANHAQALHLGIERAQSVGQFFRQHRYHAAREIDAGGTVVGIHIDRRTGFHVMADIGNGDQQAPALLRRTPASTRGRLTVDGIVKIACILAIDGDQGDVGQVDTLPPVLGPHLVGQGTRLGDAGFGEHVRHTVLAHGNLDLHAGIVHFTQYFFDTSHRLAIQGRGFDQLHHHHLTGLGDAGCAFWNQHVLPIALVFRSDQPDPALLQQATDDGLQRALDDFHHTPLGATLAVGTYDARLDAVLVQHRAHFIGRQVNVGRTIVARNKPVPIAVSENDSLHFIQRAAGLVQMFDILSFFLKCPGGGIGRRTSFRY